MEKVCVNCRKTKLWRETFRILNVAPYVSLDTQEGSICKMAESGTENSFWVYTITFLEPDRFPAKQWNKPTALYTTNKRNQTTRLHFLRLQVAVVEKKMF